METELKYSGYSATPSDYSSPDGEMALSMEMIPEHGEIRNLSKPKVVYDKLDINEEILVIHKTPVQENILTCENTAEGTSIFYRNFGSTTKTPVATFSNTSAKAATAVGNSVILTLSTGLFYLLWKDGEYIELGSKIPSFEAVPFLDTRIEDTHSFFTKYGQDIDKMIVSRLSGEGLVSEAEAAKLYRGEINSIPIYGEVQNNVYNRLFAILNLFRNELRKNGNFTEPFFIRFAYRLYDGSNTMQSVPILLIPNSAGQPIASVQITSSGVVTAYPFLASSSILANIKLPEGIEKWKDIITHIDVYVSSPMVSFTDSPEAVESLALIEEYSETGGDVIYDDFKSPITMSYRRAAGKIKPYYDNLYTFHKEQKGNYDVTPISIIGNKFHLNIRPNREYKSQYLFIDVSAHSDFEIRFANGVVFKPTTSFPPDLTPPSGTYKVYFLSRYTIQNPNVTCNYPFKGFYYRGPSNYAIKNPKFKFSIKRTDGQSYMEILQNVHNFYRICEIEMKNLGRENLSFPIQIKDNVLNSLEARKTLSDCCQSRIEYVPGNTFAYNSRLNVIVEGQYPPECSTFNEQNPCPSSIMEKDIIAYVEINQNSQIVYKKIKGDNIETMKYFSYPSANAVYLHTFVSYIDKTFYNKIPLKRNDFIDSVYAFNNFKNILLPGEGNEVSKDTAIDPEYKSIIYGNKIITSEVNNPFLFNITNESSVPVKKIYALSSATKALSTGQFGEFPVYAFTSDGIWALRISETGSYSAVQPVTRDQCSDDVEKSITQIDDAVLFATERGIMILSGSTSQCISDILDGDTFINILQLQGMGEILRMQHISPDNARIIPFKSFIKNSRMIYDYTHQRIILFSPDIGYSYVFSLEDKKWGMRINDIKSVVKSYPEAYAIDKNNRIVDFTKDGEVNKGLMITRPIKMDSPNILKTITSVYNRGCFERGSISTVLYGSRDLIHWYLVDSSKGHRLKGISGTPYKYFRIAILSNMKTDESLFGATISFIQKETNRMR